MVILAENHAIDAATEAAFHVNGASVLDLLLARVRLRARRRVAWLAHLRDGAGYGARTGIESGLGAGLAACLDDRDTPELEAGWHETSETMRPLNEVIAEVERALSGEPGERLRHLGNLFRLSETELDLLQTCLAVALDPSLAVVYGHLQMGPARSAATEPLAARLFGYGHRSLWNPGGPLAVWKLVHPGQAAQGDPPPLSVDPLIIEWLQGELRMDAVLTGRMRVVESKEPLSGWPVAEVAQAIQRAGGCGRIVRAVVAGPPSSGRKTFAAAVAARFRMRTLSVDTDGIEELDWPEIYTRAQRMAVLGSTALAWHGDAAGRRWPTAVIPAPMQFVACGRDETVMSCNHVMDHRIHLTSPTIEERRGLWRSNIPDSAAWPGAEFDKLVTRYRLDVGGIVSVARQGPSGAKEAAGLARELTRQSLGELGRLLECPFAWDDLVLPDRLLDGLKDFAFEACERAAFWENSSARRLFPRGRALAGLFGGPPGTGKTMAAQVIAAAIELDLFRVDLAGVVSKYIGETAKNLSQIFARASGMNAVLLFDEADALFSKRTDVKDAHDRHANADTSYLLQLLEEYRGIVILASNKKQNIDPAFIRRVRYVFEFPRPGAEERDSIWRKVTETLIGNAELRRLEKVVEVLALNVDLSGAQIKNAVLASIFIARRCREPMGLPHLLRGVERELAKEGRTLGPREREILTRGR